MAINRRQFMGTLAAGSAMLATGGSWAQEFQAGRHYRNLVPRVPTGLPEGRIQVVEIFWYGCPHCYNFAPYVHDWIPTLPEHVEFSHLPAPFNDLWALHARVFFAARALGILDDFHMAFFHALHAQGRNLNSESAILRFVDQRGIDADAFRDTMRSEQTAEALHEASLLVQAFQVEGVPSMVYDGRAMVSAGMAGGHPQVLQVMDYLIEQNA